MGLASSLSFGLFNPKSTNFHKRAFLADSFVALFF